MSGLYWSGANSNKTTLNCFPITAFFILRFCPLKRSLCDPSESFSTGSYNDLNLSTVSFTSGRDNYNSEQQQLKQIDEAADYRSLVSNVSGDDERRTIVAYHVPFKRFDSTIISQQGLQERSSRVMSGSLPFQPLKPFRVLRDISHCRRLLPNVLYLCTSYTAVSPPHSCIICTVRILYLFRCFILTLQDSFIQVQNIPSFTRVGVQIIEVLQEPSHHT